MKHPIYLLFSAGMCLFLSTANFRGWRFFKTSTYNRSASSSSGYFSGGGSRGYGGSGGFSHK